MKKLSHKKAQGFTLIELLVVISIIGLLSAVVLASVNQARYSANDARRFSDLREMEKALDTYYVDNGRYPSTVVGVTPAWYSMCNSAQTQQSENAIIPTGTGPAFTPTYIPSVPQDPAWNQNITNANCYWYNSNGTDYKFMDYNPSNSNTTNPKVSSFVDPYYTSNSGSGATFRWAVYSSRAYAISSS